MRTIIAAAVLSLAFGGAALASDVIVLKAKNGDVTFNHKMHAEAKMAKGCTACHETDKGGAIAGLGKDWAHKTCKGCHSEMGKGPTKCGECHKK